MRRTKEQNKKSLCQICCSVLKPSHVESKARGRKLRQNVGIIILCKVYEGIDKTESKTRPGKGGAWQYQTAANDRYEILACCSLIPCKFVMSQQRPNDHLTFIYGHSRSIYLTER